VHGEAKAFSLGLVYLIPWFSVPIGTPMLPKSLAGWRSHFVRWEFCNGYDLAH